jgi:uncharacterized membrane protein YidH (DUF202 family)
MAAERTALAWQRSSLALAAVAALTLRLAERHGPLGPGAVTAGVALAAAIATAVYGRQYYRSGEREPQAAVNRVLAVGVGALGAAAALVAVLALA